MRRRRTEISIETHQVWIFRRTTRAVVITCAECEGTPQMLTPEEAARLARVSPRVVYQWIEAGRIHFTETGDGIVLVCPAPLLTQPSWGD